MDSPPNRIHGRTEEGRIARGREFLLALRTREWFEENDEDLSWASTHLPVAAVGVGAAGGVSAVNINDPPNGVSTTAV